MSDVLLSAHELHKSYDLGRRKVEVLHGVSLEIASGDFLSLQGASGAGKSTLLHLLGGLDEPTAGEVFAGDQSLFGMGAVRLAKWRNREVGFVFQSYHLLPEFDALENVTLPARMSHTGSGVAEQRGRELLERVGLAKRMHHLPTELSGGEQQRVALARALINRPGILFADEPTGNLDSKTGDEVLDLLCELQREAKLTMIIATHDDSVASRAHATFRLADGLIA
ncbi:MAG: ABC transporter ATP-binding protein [Verrucomicrobiota bacterium]|jgi:predicted ABC-type transport system involved in lysophospholipase L1 biosynthesis ATPase subunit|nr:ABC transporter ATP-binding protein [Verrucomicrobiota bacterium]MDP7177960.1 ABC transporter ATP-binding protein [Verrucomicrobiota bacterium]MDP7292522.1 ABC transporter ATP-binding protein [Verrucomicrobiota bacterium]MDP7441402.1 ABC transporter ATP-binding protein [Verrucomicrobiota bacterium]HJN83473.1 ABC transporter ATP-binding protein [Verrucomicrobiota bacterium]|tara:strand:- start:564 stop:1238 length:675 start_codon:yes stop_codon:yes gene_type:complete